MIQVTDDGSRTLVFCGSSVAFHSASGAAEETRHVYLINGGVAERLSAGLATRVFEVGFGTGLGVLMTVDAAIAAGTPLWMTSVENRLLGAGVLSQLQLEQSLREPRLATEFLRWQASLPDPIMPGRYVWMAGPQQHVNLICEDVRNVSLADEDRVDAIYFDPFSPSENPELWEIALLKRMRNWLRADGRLVTYCVSRAVRERFLAAGFDVQKVRGPRGGKREVLVAKCRHESASPIDHAV
jgi:tRNA U34 5-methylaminomethyl-2-thiouridine-forming methyltransferase MnmC